MKMGGCYDTSYSHRESSCTKRSAPAWQNSLKSALKKNSREKLTEAYKEYFADNKSGFISEAATIQGISNIAKIPKEFTEFEYEMKFDIRIEGNGTEPSIIDYLNAFDFPVATHARFLKDPVNTNAVGINHFFGTDSEERLVIIEKEGLHLKEKSEYLPLEVKVPYREIVSKRRERRYQASLDDLVHKISAVNSETGAIYRGKIRKEKGDIFILDANDGRIYGFTITRAHLMFPGQKEERRTQRQLEIEYAGYIPGFSGFAKNSEEQIVVGIVDLARYTYAMYGNAPILGRWRMSLAPTMERKYDFVADTVGKKKPKRKEQMQSEQIVLDNVLALPV